MSPICMLLLQAVFKIVVFSAIFVAVSMLVRRMGGSRRRPGPEDDDGAPRGRDAPVLDPTSGSRADQAEDRKASEAERASVQARAWSDQGAAEATADDVGDAEKTRAWTPMWDRR